MSDYGDCNCEQACALRDEVARLEVLLAAAQRIVVVLQERAEHAVAEAAELRSRINRAQVALEPLGPTRNWRAAAPTTRGGS